MTFIAFTAFIVAFIADRFFMSVCFAVAFMTFIASTAFIVALIADRFFMSACFFIADCFFAAFITVVPWRAFALYFSATLF